MNATQPIGFIFVVVSPSVGFHKCALWCEYDTDRGRAYDKVRLSHANMFVYSSIPVYSKNSFGWDYYVRFIGSMDGEIISGLRFRSGDPFWVDVELGRGQEAETERYLSEFAVLVHYKTNSKEYVTVLDWLDAEIDSVRENVKKYLSTGVGIYAVFAGPLPASLHKDFMAANEGREHLHLGGVELIRHCVFKAAREIDSAIMLYNGAGYPDCNKVVFDDGDCSFIEECNGVGECLFKRNPDGIL